MQQETSQQGTLRLWSSSLLAIVIDSFHYRTPHEMEAGKNDTYDIHYAILSLMCWPSFPTKMVHMWTSQPYTSNKTNQPDSV